jgi:hypothetical protein
MTPEQFEALEEAIEEIELARIEQESGPQKVRLQRARDILDQYLKAEEEAAAAANDTTSLEEGERLTFSKSISSIVPLLANLLP